METMQATTVVSANEGKTLNVFGIGVDVLLRAEDTGGAFSSYRVTVQPGDGVPPHIHEHEDESFFVLSGEFEVVCGDSVSRLTAGSQIFLPRHVAHGFRNAGAQVGQLLGVAAPGGHERFFEDTDALCARGPIDEKAALEVCARHGMELLLGER
jgi:mannose-6-phosphate isomerase-like protein (cupin superfamily)